MLPIHFLTHVFQLVFFDLLKLTWIIPNLCVTHMIK